MTLIRLSPMEHDNLHKFIRSTDDARLLKRAQALLWLDQDESVTAVSRRQGVSRETIYSWVRSFQERRYEPLTARLQNHSRSGRPPKKSQAVKALVQQVVDTDPLQLGYRSPLWTAPLLRRHLKQTQNMEVSERTIRRTLRDMGYRYKRPRYVLARRSPTWRQAKGGYNAA